MNLRKTFRELKELRKHMVNPTEKQLKDYYEARNYIGVMALKRENGIVRTVLRAFRRD